MDASILIDDAAAMLARCFGLVRTTSSVRSFFEPRETSTTEIDWDGRNQRNAHAITYIFMNGSRMMRVVLVCFILYFISADEAEKNNIMGIEGSKYKHTSTEIMHIEHKQFNVVKTQTIMKKKKKQRKTKMVKIQWQRT